MYVCHYCHGYADHLDGWINFIFWLTLVQGLARRVPSVANAHLNYCFLPYYESTMQVDIT